jgi:hypothetical protein
MIRRSTALVIALGCLAPALVAQDAPVQVSDADTVRSVLARQVGKGATVKLASGEELAGKVQAVGEHVVHLAELSGKEFYDAVIDLDEVAAVILRAREQ